MDFTFTENGLFNLKAAALALAGLFLLIASPARAFDWVEPGTDAYQALAKAARQAGMNTGLAARLGRGERVPEAWARDLAVELRGDARVDAGTKEDLARYLPPIPKLTPTEDPTLRPEIERLGERIQRLEEKMGILEESRDKNVYNRGTFPSVSFNLGAGLRQGAESGFITGSDASHTIYANWTLSGTLKDGSYSFGFGAWYNSWQDNSFNLSVGGIGGVHWGDWLIAYGGERNNKFSILAYSGPATNAASPFHSGASVLPGTRTEAPAGQHGSRGWYLSHNGRAHWYFPFNLIQVVWSPSQQYYETWQGHRLFDFVTRLDLVGVHPWGFDDAVPYVTYINSSSDQANLNAWGSTQPSEVNKATAVGIEGAIVGGGNLTFEAAWSDWARGDLPKAYTDSSWYGGLNKSIGFLTLGVELSQIGADFVTGGRDDLRSGGGQGGAYLDTGFADLRPGRSGELAYKTTMREPDVMTNNSQRGSVKLDAAFSWLRLGASYASSQQLRPSGPWIESQHILGGRPYNGFNWFSLFGESYAQVNPNSPRPGARGEGRIWDYNRSSSAPAYYRGQPMRDEADDPNPATPPRLSYWNDLQQLLYRETQTFVMLSQKGVGDSNVREDSVKFVNSVKGTLSVDLRALLDLPLPSDLSFSTELRDVAEDSHVPAAGPSGLLSQSVSQCFANVGLTGYMALVGMAGYEQWDSQSSFFPILWTNRTYGAGIEFRLDPFLSGMGLGVRVTRLEHEDHHYEKRSFVTWGMSLGSNVSF